MTHKVAFEGLADGTVRGHKAGCPDTKEAQDKSPWLFDVPSKAAAWAEFNADLAAEDAYDIDWAPCAKRIPKGRPEDYLGAQEKPEEKPEEQVNADLAAEDAYDIDWAPCAKRIAIRKYLSEGKPK